MARIRTVKPEFFRSPSTSKASFAGRLLFEAMWCWADDFGVGETNINGLLGFAFCDDDGIDAAELQRLLAEVQRAYSVKFYSHQGRFYYEVPTWDSHQKNERRARRRLPTADDPDSVPDQRFHGGGGISVQLRGDSGPGTGEQGNRGTGEQGIKTCPTPSSEYPQSFEDFWSAYPRKAGKRKALASWKRAIKRTTNLELIEAANAYADDPNRSDQFTKYAEGWLNGDGWLDDPIPAPTQRATTDLRVAQAQSLHGHNPTTDIFGLKELR